MIRKYIDKFLNAYIMIIMNKYFIVMFIFLVNIKVFSENIIGKWYRNYLFANAELIINENLDFSIEAIHTAHDGQIEGKLTKIKDGYYFSYINDRYGQSCIIVFLDHIEYLELIVYGDQVGAGARVYYDGKYEKQPISHDEYIDKAFDYIIGNYYDIDTIKVLLGDDVQYFVECFGERFLTSTENNIIIDGYMSGAAPYQNGILKIENERIYILLTDCRSDRIILKYYTNDILQITIPIEFRKWQYFKEDIEIINKIGI
jgi:hypothetical protein